MRAPSKLPVIDMAPLFEDGDRHALQAVAEAIRAACRQSGFFYVRHHRIAPELLSALQEASRQFFALPVERKMAIAMAKGGRAWRGYFPVGGELTSGLADQKEGLYFGLELPPDHPGVLAQLPLHGANLWPDEPGELRPLVEAFMAAGTACGHALIRGVAMALDLPADYFESHYTADPTILFRIFHYPAQPESSQAWGVGEHSDYGLLTLLAQDTLGGLQVKTPDGWINAPPLPGTLVCNLGDMLDRLTGGWFRSTPHRVRNTGAQGRLSFPLFFDPSFHAAMKPLPDHRTRGSHDDRAAPAGRWDGADLSAFEGSYGDYLMSKVAKVFPELGDRYLDGT